MCGITGVFNFKGIVEEDKKSLKKALKKIECRGPDDSGTFFHGKAALGHTRLSILDVSKNGHQPMLDETGNYCIIFNGEIFNFYQIKEELSGLGYQFFSQTDTEVLLKAYIEYGEKCLEKLNGFFAFAIYNKTKDDIFIARDRYGIKPLYFYKDNDQIIFASELKAILAFSNIDKSLDILSLSQYLHLNYIPHPYSIFKKVKKLKPGDFFKIEKNDFKQKSWYKPNVGKDEFIGEYQSNKKTLYNLLDKAVKKRLISDVPLGSFLSGGIDSAIITGLASKHKPDLNTFSIGFRNNKFFDESYYAQIVANHFNTNHHTFYIDQQDLLNKTEDILEYFDEPFADSSSLAVYILSEKTSKYVKVALSGDGADEVFGGYNKYKGELRIRNKGIPSSIVQNLDFLWKNLPKSRNNYLTNKIRQFHRFSRGKRLSSAERYWQWCGFSDNFNSILSLLSTNRKSELIKQEYEERNRDFLYHVNNEDSLNQVLLNDIAMVLPNDMLYKVDMMSMAHSLEVRPPFLDPDVVEFGIHLPVNQKINPAYGKKILQDTFKDFLPKEIYRRPKKGFEIPLLNWLRNDLKYLVDDLILNEKFIKEQDIFNFEELYKLNQTLHSANPGDSHAKLWGLIVFQYWWKKYIY